MKAVRSKRREVFLSILGSCYTTLDAKFLIMENVSTTTPKEETNLNEEPPPE